MNDYNDAELHRLEPAYLEHYGLTEPPFAAVVDERFYFNNAEASQRMSLLVHMTQYSDMVLMVLGEEGMGKSTLLQNYIKSAHDNWHICRVNANTMMDKDQLLFRIAEDFGLASLPADSAELQEMLYDKMTQLHQNDVLPVIIIDDAHELPVDAINQLFIMAEIKAGDTTMVHMVLFAEPQIEKTINASSARKIRDRIGHYFELSPFEEADTADYIQSRLTIAGLRGENPFSAKAIRQIHKQSHGNPARINELAHIALDESLEGVLPEYEETEEVRADTDRLLTPMRVVAALLITVIAGLGLWQQDRINRFFNEPSPATPPLASQEEKTTDPFARLKQNIRGSESGQVPEASSMADGTAAAADNTAPDKLEQIEVPAIAEQLQAVDEPLPAPVLERIEPARLTASNKRQSIILHGQNFSSDTTVTLSWSGSTKQLPKSRIKLDSDKKIRIELTTGRQPDTWQVTLTDPAQGKSTTAEFQVVAAKIKSLTAAQWLAAQPANRLTLQLLGSHKLKPINQYIDQYQLQDEAIIYKTVHNNKDWYVLFYGSYANRQQARQVIEHMPRGARRNSPWIRSFKSIRAQKKTPKTKPLPPSGQTGQVPQLNSIEAHEAWLWGQDPADYTLQLFGTQNIGRIKQFISQHRLRGKVVFYHTQRDNQDWYALLYGVYPNNTDARSAVSGLPAPIKKLSPWVRNFSAIHAEMDNPQ